jgi:hypothetical protein
MFKCARKLAGPTVGLIILLAAPSAHATSFTLADYDVTLREVDPGLKLWEYELLSPGYAFDLSSVGQKRTVPLFRVGTNETAFNLDDIVPYDIDVNFAFSRPEPGFGGSSAGITGAFWLGDAFGYVVWDNPLRLAFGNNGLLGISLSHALFDLPGTADVNATFELLRAEAASPTSVPEPATLTLLAFGLGAAAAARRRRIRHTS